MKQTRKKKIRKTVNSDTIKKRIQVKQDLFLRFFERKACNVSATCKAIGINRDTYYEWRKKHTSFDHKCKEIEESLIDDAETQLYLNIRAGKETSLIFFLCNKGKHRGWQNVNRIDLSASESLQKYLSKMEKLWGEEKK
ncbi:MAG TPA: hypothetical protein ENI52_03940 [Thermoplasmata archaeon]|nr:hypothetical protein [Thermoplasmata archaeon]